jgi:hypothetical protein
MQTKEALKIIGGSLSKPSKMPGWSIGLPAKECKTGGKLQKVPGSVCFDCYALKGCYVFKVVQDAQYRRLAAIKSPDWVQAMAHLINSKKPDVFRWHDSGDVQDLDHLQKIYEVCRLTPSKRHWLPTREAWIKDHLQDKPNNLETADNAGTPQLKQFHMVNIKTKFPRGILDQVISGKNSTECKTRAPGPGLKRQASSNKLREIQASSGKHQAPSSKHQATSHKQQAPGSGTLRKVSRYPDRGPQCR